MIRPGDVQRISAGTGIRHSEFNASKTAPVHFLQIWIIPEKDGLKPSYEQKTFSAEVKRGKLRLIGSGDGREGSVTIHRDLDLYSILLSPGQTVAHTLKSGRGAWVQVVQGSAMVTMALNIAAVLAVKDHPRHPRLLADQLDGCAHAAAFCFWTNAASIFPEVSQYRRVCFFGPVNVG